MCALLGLILMVKSFSLQGVGEPYRFLNEIHIGGAGGWDYITVDSSTHRLYVSHSTKVVVVDADAGKIVGDIADTPGVHGFAIAPDLGRGFTSNGRENTSTIVDLKTLAVISKVTTGGNPDAILYEPGRKEVYTFNGSGRSATVFQAATGNIVATIELGGKPEAAVFDGPTHRVFVNIEDTGAIAAIDTSAHVVIAKWPLTGCEEPTGLAYAQAEHRLFSVCHNSVMTVVDSQSGKVVGSVPIGARVDGAAYDPQTRYVFSSNGEGTVTIAHLDTPDKLTVVQTLKTLPSARTMILDPATHRIYLPAAESAPASPGGRSTQVPDSFKVLVYGMNTK